MAHHFALELIKLGLELFLAMLCVVDLLLDYLDFVRYVFSSICSLRLELFTLLGLLDMNLLTHDSIEILVHSFKLLAQ